MALHPSSKNPKNHSLLGQGLMELFLVFVLLGSTSLVVPSNPEYIQFTS